MADQLGMIGTNADAECHNFDIKSNSKNNSVTSLLVNRRNCKVRDRSSRSILWKGDVKELLKYLPKEEKYDLVVTSPPYNIGKEYESRDTIDEYLSWQEEIIDDIIPRVKETGSICWQVGNYVENGSILPLDIEFAPMFKKHNLKLRNRIIWHYGHGLHTRKRFSGRYEVVMWYTKSDDYYFDLDAVRVQSKYPGKKYFSGPKKGQYSGNPRGKNPSDVWDIPNVKSNHVEKTEHPCQFPIGLVQRLVMSMTRKGDTVFDPFAGSGSTGVASLIHGRKFVGCEIDSGYAKIAHNRLKEAASGTIRYRPHDEPIYDHKRSKLSLFPFEKEEMR